jgi:hypothetical protein
VRKAGTKFKQSIALLPAAPPQLWTSAGLENPCVAGAFVRAIAPDIRTIPGAILQPLARTLIAALQP